MDLLDGLTWLADTLQTYPLSITDWLFIEVFSLTYQLLAEIINLLTDTFTLM